MVTREIVRVDFVKQPDGSVEFCVAVRETAPCPFNPGQTISRICEPNPMTPEMAQDRFGLSVQDIVAELNDQAISGLAAAKAENVELKAAAEKAETELAALKLANE